MNEIFYIGKIKKVYGVKGDLMLEADEEFELDLPAIKFLLLSEKKSQPIPFFLTSLLPYGKNFLVRFENANTPTEASKFVGRDAFVPEEMILETAEEENDLSAFTGFEVIDKKSGSLGKIDGVLEMPGQIIFSVAHPSGKEILLPATENFILSTDEENKIIEYNAPEGLIELYIGGEMKNETED